MADRIRLVQSSWRFRSRRCMNFANAIRPKTNRHSTTNRTMLFVGVGRFSGKRAVGSIGDVLTVARNVLNRRRLRRDGQHWAKAGVVVQARHLNRQRIRPIRPAQKGAVLVFSLACRSCGADVSRGAKRCQVCGVSTPGSLLRASIVKPTILALLWLVPLIVAYWLW